MSPTPLGEQLPPSVIEDLARLLEEHPPLPEHPTADEAALLLEELEPVTIEELDP